MAKLKRTQRLVFNQEITGSTPAAISKTTLKTMTKKNIISALKGILAFTRELTPLKQRVDNVEDFIKCLESSNTDIIVWNDIAVPMLENGKYLISNGEETNTMTAVQINSEVNHELHWVNKQCRKKYIKWAKMPEYKT